MFTRTHLAVVTHPVAGLRHEPTIGSPTCHYYSRSKDLEQLFWSVRHWQCCSYHYGQSSASVNSICESMLQSNLIFSPQASKSNVFWSLQINHNEFYGWLRIDPGAVSQQIFMATSLHMLVISTNAPRKFPLKVTLMRAIQGLTIAEKQRSRCFADVLLM